MTVLILPSGLFNMDKLNVEKVTGVSGHAVRLKVGIMVFVFYDLVITP